MDWIGNRIGTFAGAMQGLVFSLIDMPYIHDTILVIGKLFWIAIGAGVGTATQHYIKKYLEKKERK